MSTIDTSTWSPDSDLNVDIGGIPLNSDASIAQTWQAIQMLMAALKGDTSEIKLTINQPDGTTIVATNQTLTVVDNSHSHTIANVAGLQTALNGKASNADMTGATASTDGASGLVPRPEAGDQDRFLKGDGTWDEPIDTTYGEATAVASGLMSASDKAKLDGIASGAQANVIEAVMVNGTALTPSGKAVDVAVPQASSTTPSAAGTASAGLETAWARGDHVHPLQTDVSGSSGSCTGNAATASSVPWSGVTDKPSQFSPSSHVHGNITNAGELSTASRAVVTDADGVIDVSSVTATELDYLSGVTSAIQTQLDAKAGVEDVSSTFTWSNGQDPVHFHAYRTGKLVSIFYQGQIATHSSGSLLGTTTLSVAEQTFIPMVKNAAAYGLININPVSTGSSIQVSQISSSTVSGRIYFNGSIILA